MLTNEQIATVAPSVFAAERHNSRSERYAYIPTITIVEDMRANGFGVSYAGQSRAKGSNRSFTKHMLRFREIGASPSLVGEVFPEIVLTNSHDGSSSYEVSAGMFRLACSNGLVIQQSNLDSFRVRHSGDIRSQVMEATANVRIKLPELLGAVERLRAVKLDTVRELAFADQALQLKYGPDYLARHINPKRALTVRRYADTGKDLWSVMNRVQENLVRGGVRGIRPLKAIDGQTDLNKGLWALAESFAVAA